MSKNGHDHDWTPERIETASRMWAEGWSASLIAKKLGGVTRSAVIGKVYRLGVVRLEPSTPGKNLYAPKRPKDPPAPKRAKAPKPVQVYRLKPEVVREPPPVVDATFAKPWTARLSGECAFPIQGQGDGTISCCKATERTYCLAHERIMFQPKQPTMAKTMRIARIAS